MSIKAHCKVVWLRSQDLHNILIELGLFFLQGEIKRETKDVSGGRVSDVQCVQSGQFNQLTPMTKLPSAECWTCEDDRCRKKPSTLSKGNACHLYNHINSATAERAAAAVIEGEKE